MKNCTMRASTPDHTALTTLANKITNDKSSNDDEIKHQFCSSQSTNTWTRYMNSRAMPGHAYKPTDGEHIANMITHGLLVLPSVAGLLWMIHLSIGPIQHFIAFTYGMSLLALFTVSTTFHMLAYFDGKFRKLRDLFHIGDRAVIYVFIAASYTPWLTLKEYNSSAMVVLCFVWLAALLGIIYQYMFHERFKILEIIFYVGLGVLPSLIVIEMTEHSGLYELALGGAVYIAGVVFFKLDGIIPFAHAIWHCFVFIGAILHFMAVCRYLLGPCSRVHAEYTGS